MGDPVKPFRDTFNMLTNNALVETAKVAAPEPTAAEKAASAVLTEKLSFLSAQAGIKKKTPGKGATLIPGGAQKTVLTGAVDGPGAGNPSTLLTKTNG